MQLLEWQYLLFMLPIALGGLYLLLLGAGASFGGGADADADADTDLNVDIDSDVDVDADAGLDLHPDGDIDSDLAHGTAMEALGHDLPAGDHDLGTEAAGHGEAAAHDAPNVFAAVLSFLGIGRVPLSILLLSYCFVWGVAGLISLTLLGTASMALPITIALAAAVFVTRHLAVGIARLVPSIESHYVPPRHLTGLQATVLFEVTPTSGLVRLRDPEHNLRDVSCRVPPGQASIPAGTTVWLQRYAPADRVFVVAPARAKEST
jgi:hypothetical protein